MSQQLTSFTRQLVEAYTDIPWVCTRAAMIARTIVAMMITIIIRNDSNDDEDDNDDDKEWL